MEIAAGVSDVVLVGGAERVLNVATADATEYFAYASDATWEQPLGLTFPGVFALVARAHMAKYGTTEEQMAAVAVKNHRHGALNPKAQFQKEITLEQVMRSAYVADPWALRLLSVHRRRRRRRAGLRGGRAGGARWVPRRRGVGHDADAREEGLARVPTTERRGAAYRQAGVSPTDVDVVLHDCFTIAEIVHGGPGLFGGAGSLPRRKVDVARRCCPSILGGQAKGHHRRHRRLQIAEITTQPAVRRGRGKSAGLASAWPTLGGSLATVLVSSSAVVIPWSRSELLRARAERHGPALRQCGELAIRPGVLRGAASARAVTPPVTGRSRASR
jgi:acetyl-CoA C-acetyltransferase/acetyl-CoA acyltransferase